MFDLEFKVALDCLFVFFNLFFFVVYRFAQFFISPLLKEDSMKREIQAVESGEDFIQRPRGR